MKARIERALARSKQLRHIAALSVLALASACQRPNTENRASAHLHVTEAPTPDGPRAQESLRVQHLRAEGQLGPGGGTLLIDLAPPKGAKLTLDAPLSARGSGGIGLEFPKALSGTLGSHELPLRMPVEVEDGATGPAVVELSYFWCTEGNEAACRREQARLSIDLDLTGSGAGGEAHVSYQAPGDKT